MQDQNLPTNKTTNTNQPAAAGQTNVNVVASARPGAAPKITTTTVASAEDFVRKIGAKIRDSENILVALSRNPSVDEMSAAIALTLFLDKMQKHTTAIYSGKTPDALEFLRPENTFEKNTASLQDFIIALSKDKADHLRYKLEGDFVKVFITPYKTTITEKDLEFSRGDYNVDLVLALNVPTAADLDEALSEHGRIMHSATAVDITVNAPGRFGEIEWSDPNASSVSEMAADLIFGLKAEDETLDVDIATALLTGIVAATQRFSNDRTSATALNLASKLMSLGADQQLISAHVMDNIPKSTKKEVVEIEKKPDASNLAVDHTATEQRGVGSDGSQAAAQGDQSQSSQVVDQSAQPLEAQAVPLEQSQLQMQNQLGYDQSVGQGGYIDAPNIGAPMTVPQPEPPKDYAQMMADALAEASPVPSLPTEPIMSTADMPTVDVVSAEQGATMPDVGTQLETPPTVVPEAVAQNLPSTEQLMGAPVPEVPADNVVLPPPPEPPAPNVAGAVAGMDGATPPVLPEVQVPVDMPELPTQEAPATPPTEPGAFQIPGM